MKLKEKECWLQLYEIAQKIQELEPWKYLWDMDLLVYLSAPLEEVLYCSVMGRAGLHKAIAVYTERQIHKFLDFAKNEYPIQVALNYQECLMCNFSNRQEVLPKNKEIIKELGLSFRGTWISFENFEKGYEPSSININQVKIMIEALSNFYMMMRALIEERLEVDFENGKVLVRYYDEKTELYLNHESELLVPDKNYGTVRVKESYSGAMNSLPQTEMELEYEFLNYMPIRIKENKEQDGRFCYPRVRILAEKKTGLIINHELLSKNDYASDSEYMIESISYIIEFFEKFGRPKRIYVRDEETKTCLKEIADKANIKVSVKPKLKAIDYYYRELERMM